MLGPAAMEESAAEPVLLPEDTAQIATVLRVAAEARVTVVPCGAQTKLHWLGRLPEPRVLLSTRRMARMLEYNWQDMTISVEAGYRWADLEQEAGRHGQWVAADPLWPEGATVGGVVAANDSNSVPLRYRGLREQVLGMRMVLADGTDARSGGKVVKNVAGYELHKLLTRSAGTLAVIAEVNFRLYPLPKTRQRYRTMGGTITELAALLHRVSTSALPVEGAQLRNYGEGMGVELILSGSEQGVAAAEIELRRMVPEIEGPFDASLPLSSVVMEAYEGRGDHTVMFAGAMPLAKIGELVAGMHSSGVRQEGHLLVAVEGTGFFWAKVDLRDAARAAEMVRQCRAKLEECGGWLDVRGMPEAWESAIPRWSGCGSAEGLMRRVKHQFDPHGLFPAGRFAGAAG
jgi:glycolate oxidase FAD binding subunit